jgi:cell division protein FtsI (penicillin-binding protein 3)
MNAPRYAVYMMLDEPHATKATYGYATAGWVVAPAAGKVIGRIGPMLGLLPDIQNMAQINQALAIPLEPGRPAGAPARGPGSATAAVDASARSPVGSNRPNLTVPATVLPPAISRPTPDIRRQTRLVPPAAVAAPVLAVSAVAPVAAR